MRLTLRTGFTVLCATLAPACSSLGEDELQDSAGEGRFTAGDDADPSDDGPYDPGASPEESGEGESGGSDSDDDRPLEPAHGTTDGGATTSDGDDETGTAGTSDDSGDTNETDDGLDDGTTSDAPQTNGAQDDSGTASGTDDGTCRGLDCLPPCEPNVCDTPCDAELDEGMACAGEGGAVATCVMGVWTCGP